MTGVQPRRRADDSFGYIIAMMGGVSWACALVLVYTSAPWWQATAGLIWGATCMGVNAWRVYR